MTTQSSHHLRETNTSSVCLHYVLSEDRLSSRYLILTTSPSLTLSPSVTLLPWILHSVTSENTSAEHQKMILFLSAYRCSVDYTPNDIIKCSGTILISYFDSSCTELKRCEDHLLTNGESMKFQELGISYRQDIHTKAR